MITVPGLTSRGCMDKTRKPNQPGVMSARLYGSSKKEKTLWTGCGNHCSRVRVYSGAPSAR
jgi:hypothetical protein